LAVVLCACWLCMARCSEDAGSVLARTEHALLQTGNHGHVVEDTEDEEPSLFSRAINSLILSGVSSAVEVGPYFAINRNRLGNDRFCRQIVSESAAFFAVNVVAFFFVYKNDILCSFVFAITGLLGALPHALLMKMNLVGKTWICFVPPMLSIVVAPLGLYFLGLPEDEVQLELIVDEDMQNGDKINIRVVSTGETAKEELATAAATTATTTAVAEERPKENISEFVVGEEKPEKQPEVARTTKPKESKDTQQTTRAEEGPAKIRIVAEPAPSQKQTPKIEVARDAAEKRSSKDDEISEREQHEEWDMAGAWSSMHGSASVGLGMALVAFLLQLC